VLRALSDFGMDGDVEMASSLDDARRELAAVEEEMRVTDALAEPVLQRLVALTAPEADDAMLKVAALVMAHPEDEQVAAIGKQLVLAREQAVADAKRIWAATTELQVQLAYAREQLRLAEADAQGQG